MNTHYRRSDFEPSSKPLQFFCGLVIVLFSLLTGAWIGFQWRDGIQRELDKAKPLPVRKQAQNPPPYLIGCDRPAVLEVARTCAARRKAI